MALKQYRVLEESYIEDAIRKPGDIVTIDPEVMKPGSNLEPVEPEKPAKPARD